MTWVVPELRFRVQIREGVQTDNSAGGFDRTYNHKVTVWAGFKPLKPKFPSESYIRNQQIGEQPTHEFVMRRNPSLGIDFVKGSYLLKKDHFLFVETDAGDKKVGRLFYIEHVMNVNERNEFIKITAREMEMQEEPGLVI